MALTVRTASPGKLSGVGYAQPGTLGPVTYNSGGLQGSTYNPQQTYNPQRTSAPSGQVTAFAPAGGGTSSPVSTGPSAAQVAETNRMNNVRRDIGVSQDGIRGGSRQQATDNTNRYRTDGQSFVNGVRTGQNTINTSATNNALNTRRSMAGIASDVRTGIQSGKISLSAMNASDSGATEAMARAWATVGNRQAAGVRNQAQLETNALQTEQTNLDLQETQGWQNLQTWRTTETDRVSNKLYNELATLQAKGQAEGVDGIVDMGYRDRLIADATAELNQIDDVTRGELAAIGGLSPEQIEAAALAMDEAGAQVANPFQIDQINQQLPTGGTPGAEQISVRRPEDELVQV